jgi:hypothetical protein
MKLNGNVFIHNRSLFFKTKATSTPDAVTAHAPKAGKKGLNARYEQQKTPPQWRGHRR